MPATSIDVEVFRAAKAAAVAALRDWAYRVRAEGNTAQPADEVLLEAAELVERYLSLESLKGETTDPGVTNAYKVGP